MEFRTALDKAVSFIMDPANHTRSPAKQKAAWATTVLLCIGTAGISLGLSEGTNRPPSPFHSLAR